MNLTGLHSRMRSTITFVIFTWFTRIMLCVAFIPSGIKKLFGMRFTTLGTDNPVGFFFEALYQTGFYWNFLGFVQLLAALLIIIPRTTFLGAMIYLPIIINILVIVTAMGFKGTPIVALLMLLGNLYLFFWEFDRTRVFLKAVAVNKWSGI